MSSSLFNKLGDTFSCGTGKGNWIHAEEGLGHSRSDTTLRQFTRFK